MDNSPADSRAALLTQWAGGIARAAAAGALGGRPLALRRVEAIRGPRAGALEIDAGIEAGRLLRLMTADDNALLRQFITWPFAGEPVVYMSGRFVRLEAGWPESLAEKDIPLGQLGRHPHGEGRWIAGKNESGATVTLGVDGTNPHYLFGGQTGSGKTWALRAALFQLAQAGDNRLILIDCKWGDGLGRLGALPGLVGPVATDAETAKSALAWAAREMRYRYEAGGHTGRLLVAIDEVQELQDEAAVALLRRLVTLGRGAGIHVLIGTQHPTKAALGDATIKRNLTGRVALRVEDGVASNLVVGAPAPRADHLLGAGDAYAVVPGRVQRVQLAYVPPANLERYSGRGVYTLEVWPPFDPEAAGTLPEEGARPDTAADVGAALLAAHLGKGRPWLRGKIGAATGTTPGNEKAQRLLRLGREIYAWLNAEGVSLTPLEGESSPAGHAPALEEDVVW